MITLLHTNDLHNHLTQAQADRLARMRAATGADGLLLDAGDAVGSGNITFRPGGEPILDRMAAAGYEAMTIGNREFHFTDVGFRCKLKRAPFPILCANVRASDRGEANGPLPVQPFVTLAASGVRVVVFGVTVPMITERMLARKLSPYVFDDPVRSAAELVPRLLAEHAPCLLIALTHIGYRQDVELARNVPGIHIVIGGHSHTVLPNGERVGEALVVQTGSWGHNFGRVAIQMRPGDARPAAVEAEVLPL